MRGAWRCDHRIEYAGEIHLYAYTDNDPLNLTDPSGNCPWCVAAGAGLGGVGGYIAGYHNTGSIWGGIGGAIVGGAVGAVTRIIAPQLSEAAGGGAGGAFAYTAVNMFGGGVAAAAIDVAQGQNVKTTANDIGNGMLIGGGAPLVTGDAVLGGALLGGGKVLGLTPGAADIATLATGINSGVVSTLGSIATTCSTSNGSGPDTNPFAGYLGPANPPTGPGK
jgi:hypothetical protein